MSPTPHKVDDILDNLAELAGEHESVSVDQVMHAFGQRTFGPAIMIPALLEITPVGAVPGVPTFLATIVMLVAAQKMLGRRSLWLPGIIGNRCLKGEKLAKATEKLRPLAAFMDRHFHRRLKFMTRAPFSQFAAGMVILLCLTVPFLELLPFASSVPMLAIAGFGLAVLVRDGVLMLVALALSLGAMGMGLDYWDGGLSDTQETDGVVPEETVESIDRSAKEAGAKAQEVADGAGEAASKVAAEAASKAGEAAAKAGEAASEAGEAAAATVKND